MANGISLGHNRKVDYFRKFDYFLMVTVLTISAIGITYLRSAQYNKYLDHGQKAMIVQIIGLVLGVVFCVAMTLIDYEALKKLYIPFYAANVLLMLAVFVPGLGTESGGSRSWLNLGITTYQPSEMMKLAMVLFVAVYLERAKKDGMKPFYAVMILGGFLLPLGLVFLQNDMGMAIVYVFTFFVMLYVGEIKLRLLFGVLALGVMMVPFVWKFYLNGTRRVRFLGFLDPDNELYYDYTLQLRRSLSAISAGGLFGEGLGEGTMNTQNKILVKLTDMIFSVICEEGGFLMAAILIFLFILMLSRMLDIASKSDNMFGKCVSSGVFAMFFIVIFQNLAMNVGLMPITGLALPFVSQGGSAMLTNYIAVGVIMSISMRRQRGFFID